MSKWIMKIMIIKLAEPILDTIIEILEKIASDTTNQVDDIVVWTLKKYKQLILDYIQGQIKQITERSK